MTPLFVEIIGTGVVCTLGRNTDETMEALALGRSGLHPLTRFIPPHHDPLPVGQILADNTQTELPPTHWMARLAGDEAMANCRHAPDAIVLGVTTGGMAVTEALLKAGHSDPKAYGYHGFGSVAADLAARYGCTGPVMTVSTACSSGGGAIALAMAMLRTGAYQRILAGGVDCLCRMTYYGFKSLQLIDPDGSRPLDGQRRGMSVAEGAGMLLLEATRESSGAIQLLGAALSCDAHHPTQPHPDGKGALAAMKAALSDAGLDHGDIDYINLHGTGTKDNDRAEAKAIHALFGASIPPVSSIKGATGHSLAASGAIEAVVAAQAVARGLIPGNNGYQTPDPELNLIPVTEPIIGRIDTVLSNSFGFGGNNASVIIGRSSKQAPASPVTGKPLFVKGWAAITGAGGTRETLAALRMDKTCFGRTAADEFNKTLPPLEVRRLKRLSLMTVTLAVEACRHAENACPEATFFGTGWGSLSETHDFLKGLFESEERFPSPIDFMGSVHNAPTGHVARICGATGANITATGGDYSFEQALISAQLLTPHDRPVLVLGADEGHDRLSTLFDRSVPLGKTLSDGGGGLVLQRKQVRGAPTIDLKHFETGYETPPQPDQMVARLGGAEEINRRYGLVLDGIPAAQRATGRKQLDRFLDLTGYPGPVIDYRRLTGEFATATAVAAVFASALVQAGGLPALAHQRGRQSAAGATAALIIGLGSALTAIEVAAT